MTLKFFASGDVVNQKGNRDFLSQSMMDEINQVHELEKKNRNTRNQSS